MTNFIREQALKFVSDGYSRVFVWPDGDDHSRILGYYTLSAGHFERSGLRSSDEKRAVKGIPVPIAHLGYMGKADGVEAGFGKVLIIDAARRAAAQSDIGIWGLSLYSEGYPENQRLAAWYEDVGFTHAKTSERAGLMYGPLKKFIPPGL